MSTDTFNVQVNIKVFNNNDIIFIGDAVYDRNLEKNINLLIIAMKSKYFLANSNKLRNKI